MNDKVDWEVVDAEPAQNSARRTPDEFLSAALGPWWRWKVGAMLVFGGIALLFLVAFAGIVVLTALAFALLSLAFVRIKRWLGNSGSHDIRR